MASYTYELGDSWKICHMNGATENDYGIKVFLIKDCGSGMPPEFVKDMETVNKLFNERPTFPKDAAFIQVCLPAQTFTTYSEEAMTFVMPVTAYLKLLEFFRTDFPLLMKRLDSDAKRLSEPNEWVRLSPTIHTSTVSNICYKNTLDVCNNFLLDLIVVRNLSKNMTQIKLKYSDETMGSITLPAATMINLSKDRPTLTSLLDYKEGNSRKRSHLASSH